jgi:inner membrane protein
MLPLWAVLLGGLFAWLARDIRRWRPYAKIVAGSIAIHIAGDWITSYGTMMFAPLSDARYDLSTTFIIDLWFTGIIFTALVGAWIWRRTRVPALLGLGVLGSYVAFQFALQQRAVAFGEEHARSQQLRALEVKAMPRPVSPFNWMVIITESERYHYALVNLVRRNAPDRLPADAGFFQRLDAPYLPLSQAAWVAVPRYGSSVADIALAQEAYRQPDFEFFRWFAAYPAVFRVDRGNPDACVWFEDLRFFTPGRSGSPFRYGMCREPHGTWQPFRLTAEAQRTPLN